MEITVELDLPALQCFTHHQFYGIYFREEFYRGRKILAVQIVAWETAPIIAYYNTVRIKHGNNFENKAFSESLGDFLVADQELQQALHNVWAITFSRVNTACEYDALPPGNVVLGTLKIGYYEHL